MAKNQRLKVIRDSKIIGKGKNVKPMSDKDKEAYYKSVVEDDPEAKQTGGEGSRSSKHTSISVDIPDDIKKSTLEIKRKRGRVTKYDPRYCEMIVEYGKKHIHLYTTGNFGAKRPVDYPTKEKFCIDTDLDEDTLTNREKKYPDFFGAMEKFRQIQKYIALVNGMNGLYKANFSTFLLTNVFPKEFQDKKVVDFKDRSGSGTDNDDLTKEELLLKLQNIKQRKNQIMSKKQKKK